MSNNCYVFLILKTHMRAHTTVFALTIKVMFNLSTQQTNDAWCINSNIYENVNKAMCESYASSS